MRYFSLTLRKRYYYIVPPCGWLLLLNLNNYYFFKINGRKIVIVLSRESQFLKFSLQDERWSKTFEPKLQKLLSELEAGLSTVLRRSDPNYAGTKFSEDDVRGLFCSYIFYS